MSSKIKVGMIEDDNLIREGFTLLINASDDYECIVSYGSCESALKDIENHDLDVMLVDIELPGMSGIEGIKKIRRLFPRLNVIVITVHEDDDLIFDALCSGATGYMTKNTPPEKLLDAIKDAHHGGAPMSTQIARKVVNSFQRNLHSPLTARETEVLELLSKGKSYSTIADELFVNKETIRTHIKNIYLKLEVHSKAEAIEKALKNKLI
ncbi:response regulator transcription factor [Hyphobacterium sp. CCMP332]|nr:response regulator transcription factor [Hyphobacterium sp. CCMP332]